MPDLLLINPRKRKKKMAKRRTAAQKRATRKLIAFNKARKSLNKRRAKNPTRRKRRVSVKRRRSPARMVAPVRRRRRRVVRRRNPVRRRAARQNQLVKTATVSMTSAVGALGLDVLMGYLQPYIPANMAGGAMGSVVKAAAAIGMGMVAERVVKKSTAQQFVVGALTVNLHSVLKELVAQQAPQIPLAGYAGDTLGFYSPGMIADGGMSAYDMSAGMGAYSTDSIGPY